MLMNSDPVLSSDNIFQQLVGFKKQLSDSSMNQVIQSAMDFIVWKKSITNPNAEIISTKIEKLTIELGKAELYSEGTLNFGEL